MITSYIYLFLAIFLWSLIPLISKLAGIEVPLSIYLLLSNFLSFFITSIFIDFSKIKKNIDKELIKRVAFFGFLGVFGYYLLLYYAYTISEDTILIVIVQYLWPSLMVLFSFLLLREPLSIKKILALFLSFLAFLLTATKGFSFLPSLSNINALIVAFIAANFFALYSVLSKKFVSKDIYLEVALTFLFAFFYSFIFYIFNRESFNFNLRGWIFILVNGLFINGISYLFWIKAIQKIELSIVAVYLFLTPLLGALWVILFLDVSLKGYYLFSLALIALSIILINRK